MAAPAMNQRSLLASAVLVCWARERWACAVPLAWQEASARRRVHSAAVQRAPSGEEEWQGT